MCFKSLTDILPKPVAIFEFICYVKYSLFQFVSGTYVIDREVT